MIAGAADGAADIEVVAVSCTEVENADVNTC